MKKLKSYNLIFVLLLISINFVKAQQEATFSQYMFNMINVNPAFAGSRGVDNITLLYRNQWMGVEGAPETLTASWDRRADDSNVGYGLQIYNDHLGIERTLGLQLFYSYYIAFENSYLSLGLGGGVINYLAEYTKAVTGQPDPILQNNLNVWLPSAGFGLLYFTSDWYISFSIPTLLHTKSGYIDKNFYGSNSHYFLNAGYNYSTTEFVKIKPSLMIKAVQGSPIQIDYNVNCWFNNILGIGGSYRTGDALVSIVELQLSKTLRLGYSYDYTISEMKKYNRGTHELMLRYEFRNNRTAKYVNKDGLHMNDSFDL